QSVASMVVWEEGQAKKTDYRKYRIKTVEGANDFASMQEVVARRYHPSQELALPDLVMIDGGLGQLMAAMEGLRAIGRTELAMIGLAKARGEKEERVFLPGRKNPVLLNPSSPATHLLQRIRDEAHRFAITYHRKLRGKALVASELDAIIGVGTIRKNRLLKTFGNLEQIAGASDDQLRKAGLDNKTVDAVRKAFSSARSL
ncbi:MAG TPA: excinuclease ABC subunit UvrC, partial [Nitrospiraceae bacterium]|nr:excinuclease ABC subunit UvrC [Nitrospiraceae bacterium]